MRILPLVSLACLPMLAGCTCRRTGGESSPSVSTAPSANVFDMQLARQTLFAFGNTTALPVSPEFSEEVPQVGPPLERAAKMRETKPIRIRVERDVPFGQLTRLMQAGIGARIGAWEVMSSTESGAQAMLAVPPPGPMPRGDCWTRAWVGPDRRVQMMIEGNKGAIVLPREGHVNVDGVLAVLRRLDDKCKDGIVRLYSQPTATWGAVFDLGQGILTATNKPHVSTLQVQVPSIGPLDSADEVYKQ